MWQRILSVVVLGSITHAQMLALTGAVVGRQPPAVTTSSETSGAGTPTEARPPFTPMVSSYERHNQLRRDRDEEFAVILCNNNHGFRNCPLSYAVGRPLLLPLSLKLDPVPGVQVRFRIDNEVRTRQDGGAVWAPVGVQVFRLKIRAGKNVALGPHVLEGRLSFEVRDGKGFYESQEIPVKIPLTVVEHDANVVEARWSLERRHHYDIGTIVLMTLTAPIWGPFFLLLLASCGLSGGEC